MPSWGYLIIIILFILVLMSAFFSASEITFAVVNKIKLEKTAKQGNKKAARALKLANNYSDLISVILIGNNLVNIAASSIATVLALRIWPQNGATIAAIGMTVIILVFGEVLPKTILSKYNLTVVKLFSLPLEVFRIIFKPIVFIVTKIVDKISPLWKRKKIEEVTTDEELTSMVDELEEDEFIDEDTGDLIRSAIEFTDLAAFEIMIPRVDIFSFDIDDDINQLLEDENIFKYSRVPVYKDTIDNIIGILSTKTLIKYVLLNKKINVREIMTKPIFVHKTKQVSMLLKEFKQTHTHIAIILDEFGGTLGMITLEDIVEEIVGDIWDEMDTVEEEYKEEADGIYIIDGDMNIYDLFELVEYDSDDFDSEYTTVGGWCTEMLDEFPKVNDTFSFANLIVTVLAVEGIRVVKVKVEIVKVEDEEE